jgi:hypothetical protein
VTISHDPNISTLKWVHPDEMGSRQLVEDDGRSDSGDVPWPAARGIAPPAQ